MSSGDSENLAGYFISGLKFSFLIFIVSGRFPSEYTLPLEKYKEHLKSVAQFRGFENALKFDVLQREMRDGTVASEITSDQVIVTFCVGIIVP